MNARSPSNSRAAARTSASLLALLFVPLAAGACSAPLGGRELDLGLSAQALPGAGVGVSLAQRLLDQDERRIDFEAGLDRQELSDESAAGNNWTRLWAGVRCAAGENTSQWQGRAGVNWLRIEAQAGTLDDPGDYGGVYAGLGYVWEVAPALAMGPDLTLMFVDSEGTRSGSGALAEFAWRWVWHL